MIVSVSGLISSGKNAVADYLVEQHGFVKDSFASSLKDAVSGIFGWDREMLEGITKEAREEREKVDQWWANRFGIPNLSPRWVLQRFGTDVCRNHFHQDIWLASLENRLLKRQGENIVISDSRFMNEMELLCSLNGVTVVVKRGEAPSWWDVAARAYSDPKAMLSMKLSSVHPSEWDWASYEFDETIDNNGTLADLYQTVDGILIRNQR